MLKYIKSLAGYKKAYLLLILALSVSGFSQTYTPTAIQIMPTKGITLAFGSPYQALFQDCSYSGHPDEPYLGGLPSWKASTAFAQYKLITDGTNTQQAVTAGTSGSSTP